MVLSSHTSSLFWFRIDMMKDFIKRGHIVLAFGPEAEADWKGKFKENNIEYRQLYVERNGLNPFKDIKTFIELYKATKNEKPDKIFVYQAKTIVYGSIAARLNGITEVYSLFAGLGSIFRGTGLKAGIIKMIMKTEYKIACKCSKKLFFQNNDDKNEFVDNRLVKENKTVIINGSGVNLDKFRSTPLPDKPAFLYIGRLIRDKGIVEYLEACKILKKNNPEIRCMLIGPFDSNPSALKPEELQPYINDGIVEYYGEQQDVRPYISQCSTYVLPSYHEGTPKTVLESMAMGRSIITSDAPGCRETVEDGVNGFLIPVKNVDMLVEKMIWMIEHPERTEKMAEMSRDICKKKYDVNKVNGVILQTMNL